MIARSVFIIIVLGSVALATPKLSFIDRLRDQDGPVPGLAGFATKRKPSKTHCGGVEIVTTRPKHVAPEDELIASVFALKFPANLSFDHTNLQRSQASIKIFADWLETMRAVGDKVRRDYEATLAADDSTVPAEAKVAAMARLAQISARFASVLGRAEIPLDVRTGVDAADKIKAYCDSLQAAAEPLLQNAEEAMHKCAKTASELPGSWRAKAAPARAWWDQICVDLITL